ncbi:trimeric intracellular cation channel family protein [Arcanobacterium haemolyticum]|nr:trimeric intracellular cation channel family protein [Arcanobacterium haemolyticum]
MQLAEIFPDVIRFLDVCGVFVSGILGGMVAREKHFDIIGFFALAVMAALGGGMLRDVLLQQGFPVALTDPYYLAAALSGAIIAFLLRMTGKWWNRFFIVSDAFVIGAWSAVGTVKALSAGLGVLPAMMLGVITAVGGGAIRDVAVGRVPAVFGGNTLYATASLLGTLPCIVLWKMGYPTVATLSSALLGGGICIAARWYKWRLPQHKRYPLTDAYGKVRMSFAEYMEARESAKKRAIPRGVGSSLGIDRIEEHSHHSDEHHVDQAVAAAQAAKNAAEAAARAAGVAQGAAGMARGAAAAAGISQGAAAASAQAAAEGAAASVQAAAGDSHTPDGRGIASGTGNETSSNATGAAGSMEARSMESSDSAGDEPTSEGTLVVDNDDKHANKQLRARAREIKRTKN